MRLLSFHADGFGILAQTGAEGLGPGINIFLGDNEAGKSHLSGLPAGHAHRLSLRAQGASGRQPCAADRPGAA